MQQLQNRQRPFTSGRRPGVAPPPPRVRLGKLAAIAAPQAAAAEPASEASTSGSHSSSSQQQHAPAFRAAIDFKRLKETVEQAVENCRKRNSNADPQRAVQLYDEFVKLKADVDALRADRNANAASMKVWNAAQRKGQSEGDASIIWACTAFLRRGLRQWGRALRTCGRGRAPTPHVHRRASSSPSSAQRWWPRARSSRRSWRS